MSSNPGWVELGVRGTSVLSRRLLEPKMHINKRVKRPGSDFVTLRIPLGSCISLVDTFFSTLTNTRTQTLTRTHLHPFSPEVDKVVVVHVLNVVHDTEMTDSGLFVEQLHGYCVVLIRGFWSNGMNIKNGT